MGPSRHGVTRKWLASFALIATLIGGPAIAQNESWLTGSPDLSTIDPTEICNCTGQSLRGGIETAKEFFETYDWIEYQSDEEALLAWEIFSTVNKCEATILVGRLGDLSDIAGRSGTCVLHDYQNWTPGINDAYILGGVNRAAVFEAVSPPIGEIELEGDDTGQKRRRNVYNRELMLVQREGGYQLSGEIATASPDNPAHFTPIDKWSLQLSFNGALAELAFPSIPFDVADDGRVQAHQSEGQSDMALEGIVGGRDVTLALLSRGWDDDANGMVEVFNLSLEGEVRGGLVSGTFDGRVADFECAMQSLFEKSGEVCGTLETSGTWKGEQQR